MYFRAFKTKCMNLVDTLTKLYHEKTPFVVFRKPFSNQVEIFQQIDNQVYTFDNSFSNEGFVLAPFDTEAEKSFLLRAEKKHIFTIEHTDIQQVMGKELIYNELEKEKHISLVEKAIEEMKLEAFEKVVLSRKISTSTEKNPIAIFEQMMYRYRSAFCFLFSHPNIGTWLASTPEKLMYFSENQLFTMSLAGTQPFTENEIIWRSKEKEEQQIVTETIVNQLTPFVKKLNVSEPKTVRAGGVVHLCTEISATLKEGKNPFEVVKKLHPTPAVCGFPTEKARNFILEKEGYNRSFYTGYSGIVHSEEKSFDLYVTLRCMQMIDNQCFIYVGGGVLKESDAEAEWKETQNKSFTMLSVL